MLLPWLSLEPRRDTVDSKVNISTKILLLSLALEKNYTKFAINIVLHPSFE